MDRVTLISVGGDSKIDNLIKDVSPGAKKYGKSHVAMLLFDGVYESTGLKEEYDPYPGVWLHNPHKYDNNPGATFIEVEVPDIEAMEDEARRLLGTPYGYTDCVKTGLYELFGIEIPDNDWGIMCSELCTRLFRTGKVPILPEVPAGCISPERLTETILYGGYGQKILENISKRG
jgi:hypothetical protein